MLTIFGSLVLDTIHTPGRVNRETLGGSAAYAALASSFFTKTNLAAVAGDDFPREHVDALSRRMDVGGLSTVPGKTFRYEARYEDNFESRVDLAVEPNVSEGFRPDLPPEYLESDYVYLANSDPVQQTAALKQFRRPKMVMCDTIGHWINTKRDDVVGLVGMVDAAIINDGEARLLAGRHGLAECARTILEWGPRFVIIKKAEHGSVLFHGDEAYPLPGFPLGAVADPTGAGDSFAGAVMGHMDSAGSVGLDGLRRACLYGNVLGSFAVERHGVDGLLGLTRERIRARARAYRDMTCTEM